MLRARIAFFTGIVFCGLALSSCGGSGTVTGTGPTQPQATLSLATNPSSLTMVPNSSFTVTVTFSEQNTSANPSLTLSGLPTGMTSSTQFPLSLQPSGGTFTLQTSSNLALGNYSLALSGLAGNASTTLTIPVTVQSSSSANFQIDIPNTLPEMAAGTSQNISIFTPVTGTVLDYNLSLQAAGLPTGVTATFNPSVIYPSQMSTMTLTAANNAPLAQNAIITVTGIPSAPLLSQSASFDETIAPASPLPNNRTDYTLTGGTPFGAVYDPVHQLIFASNPSWNRIDVISATTHTIQTQISVKSPQGIAISPDDSHVWVTCLSQQIYSIDTSALTAVVYNLPEYTPPGFTKPESWEGFRIYAFADSTFLLDFGPAVDGGILAIWNPTANTLTNFGAPFVDSAVFITVSGDGTMLYAISADSSGTSYYYNVATRTFSSPITLGEYNLYAAANQNGTRVAVADAGGDVLLYDGNLNFVGNVPGGGVSIASLIKGGVAFSADNQSLYEICMPIDIPLIYKIGLSNLRTASISPAMPMIPWATELSPPFYLTVPIGVDASGMVYGIQFSGIAFEDGAFPENYATLQPGSPTFLQHMTPYTGPLGGGTTSSGFGNSFILPPTVWYGQNMGSTNNASEVLSITSPAGNAPGPVNIKMLFPDGTEAFDPQFFSYGPQIQYAVESGGSPAGGAAAQIAVFGGASDYNNAQLTVSGSTASIIPTPQFYVGGTSEAIPSTSLSYTIPPGTAGWADLRITTANGSSTLPKSFFYAQSVTDYLSTDTFTAILLDPNRHQLYISAGDHIDVFSLGANQFTAPITPPAIGSSKAFAGLALTPDGTKLLATDVNDGSLAVIDPDNSANNYVIQVEAPQQPSQGCIPGPLYVASTNTNLAFVLDGQIPGKVSCGPGGPLFKVDLIAKTSVPANLPITSCGLFDGGTGIASTTDGSTLAIENNGLCLYNVAQQTQVGPEFAQAYGATISGDGNVAASQWTFVNSAGQSIGGVAQPGIYFGNYGGGLAFEFNTQFSPLLNQTGSLYYIPYDNFFDIIDVQHGMVMIRFALTETITDTASAMAIDAAGDSVYLLTNKGLTVVNLGQAPLAIGWLSSNTAATGSEITIRGSGFTSSTTAMVNGQAATVGFIDSETLTLTIPSVASGPATIVLSNTDGKSYALANVLTVQ